MPLRKFLSHELNELIRAERETIYMEAYDVGLDAEIGVGSYASVSTPTREIDVEHSIACSLYDMFFVLDQPSKQLSTSSVRRRGLYSLLVYVEEAGTVRHTLNLFGESNNVCMFAG